jgi:hypothetical protein
MLFSRKNYKLANRPKLNVWLKGERIEQVNKHRILGLIFDERKTWNESESRKEDEYPQIPYPHQMGNCR